MTEDPSRFLVAAIVALLAPIASTTCAVGDLQAQESRPSGSARGAVPTSAPTQRALAVDLPRAIASFGAARCDGFLYVQGGHVGKQHAHSKDNVVAEFWRLDLDALEAAGDDEAAADAAWQRLPDGAAVQGTALAAWDGKVYSVGGLTAHNAPGEDEDLHSIASVACFDPTLGEWVDTTPLPEPRSSHDATVIDGKLYVVGGWQLAGPGHGTWHDTAWVADLSREPLVWEELPAPPFRRRALAVARLGDRLAVLGGMDETSSVAPETFFLDLEAGTWREGPMFPDNPFGIAAFGEDDRVLASGFDGKLRALTVAGMRGGVTSSDAWQPVCELGTGRFFHQLVPLDDDTLLALGGACRAGHLTSIERLDIGAPTGL